MFEQEAPSDHNFEQLASNTIVSRIRTGWARSNMTRPRAIMWENDDSYNDKVTLWEGKKGQRSCFIIHDNMYIGKVYTSVEPMAQV